jgi:hypothetical protein
MCGGALNGNKAVLVFEEDWSAILLNHPSLVQLLLSHGANPHLKIESSKTLIDGKDSFHWRRHGFESIQAFHTATFLSFM